VLSAVLVDVPVPKKRSEIVDVRTFDGGEESADRAES
jgi:hypothetical protein